MDNKSFIETLKWKKENNNRQIEKLKGDNEAIDRLLQRYSTEQLEIADTSVNEKESLNNNVVGPTEAIRRLFNQFSTKKWTASQLYRQLEILKKSGKLKTNSQNLRYTVHWILRTLSDKGKKDRFLEKKGKGHGSYYKKHIPIPSFDNVGKKTQNEDIE